MAFGGDQAMRILLSFVFFGGLTVRPSPAVTLTKLARTQPLTIRAIAPGESPDLGEGNQTNNLKEGGNVLMLSGKDLTSLTGISHLSVLYRGRPTPIAEVASLQLFLNRNALSALPDEMAELDNITFLYAFYNQFEALPPAVTRMKGLQGLYLTGNHIRELPAALFAMHGLRKLQVSKNLLSAIPPAIGNLTQLIHLNLSENQIGVLPATIANLRELRVCDLSDNRLDELPEGFGRVKILYQLRVRNNPLRTLPPGFAAMPGTIDITGTKIDPATLAPALRTRIDTKKPAVKPSRDDS